MDAGDAGSNRFYSPNSRPKPNLPLASVCMKLVKCRNSIKSLVGAGGGALRARAHPRAARRSRSRGRELRLAAGQSSGLES